MAGVDRRAGGAWLGLGEEEEGHEGGGGRDVHLHRVLRVVRCVVSRLQLIACLCRYLVYIP